MSKTISIDEIIEREKLDTVFVKEFLRSYFSKNRVTRLINGRHVVADFVPSAEDLEVIVDNFPRNVRVELNTNYYGSHSHNNVLSSYLFPEEVQMERDYFSNFLRAGEKLEDGDAYPAIYLGHYCLYWFIP